MLIAFQGTLGSHGSPDRRASPFFTSGESYSRRSDPVRSCLCWAVVLIIDPVARGVLLSLRMAGVILCESLWGRRESTSVEGTHHGLCRFHREPHRGTVLARRVRGCRN